MKNVFRLIGVIAIAAVIGFSFISCPEPDGGGGGGDESATPEFTVTPYTRDAIRVRVDSFPDATGYKIYRSLSPSGPYSPITDYNYPFTNYITFTHTNLAADTTYYFKVSAVFNGKEGRQSPAKSAKTYDPSYPAYPTAPQGVTATADGNGITVNWTAVTGATGYIVSRGLAETGSYSYVGYVSTTSFTDNIGLTNGNTYYYRVTTLVSVPNSNKVITGGSNYPNVSAQATANSSEGSGTGIVSGNRYYYDSNVLYLWYSTWSSNNPNTGISTSGTMWLSGNGLRLADSETINPNTNYTITISGTVDVALPNLDVLVYGVKENVGGGYSMYGMGYVTPNVESIPAGQFTKTLTLRTYSSFNTAPIDYKIVRVESRVSDGSIEPDTRATITGFTISITQSP